MASSIETIVEQFKPINESNRRIMECTTLIEISTTEFQQTATRDDKAVLQAKVAANIKCVTGKIIDCKSAIEHLAAIIAKTPTPTSTSTIIQRNLLMKTKQEFTAVVEHYSVALAAWNAIVENDYRSALKIGSTLDGKQIDAVIATGNAQQVITQMQSGEELKDIVDQLQQRSQSISALERNIKEVQKLFVDLSMIVDQQGDVIDNIQMHVNAARDHVDNADHNLGSAAQHQSTYRKRQCCIFVIVVVVLLIVVLPTVLAR